MALSPNQENTFSFKNLLCSITRPFMDIEIGNIIERVIRIKEAGEKNELINLQALLTEIELDPCITLEQSDLIEQWKEIIVEKLKYSAKICKVRANYR